MALDGFYEVDFSAVTRGARGIVIVENGSVRGADDQYLYAGTMTGPDDQIQVKLAVKAYAPDAVNVFNTRDGKYDLYLNGKVVGQELHFEGPAPATFPRGPRITIVARRLSSVTLD
ncbi:GrlR family regulatory protein [Paraburkholderia sp. BL17N1]|uniref:GrlR family regulatory protein n=1 Tax=Paraburkholderia sp. BL17N1 TaxID=1938798 RepID=UPI000EB577A8|nr:GrlR family regulatory protein [Paraburkholderia sp. BL17N1]RKR46296.1 type III secretion system (T3SS) negative regulator GrlR [Paraburkholderia sp. BL17N1]